MKLKQVGGIVMAALLGGACAAATAPTGSGGSANTGGDSPTGGKATSSGATSSGATSSGATGTGGGDSKVPYCRIPCSTPQDCTVGTQPVNDASHYACEDTKCRYLGCVSDEECAAQSSVLVCAPNPILGVPTCGVACATANDCGTDTPGTSDHSHFTCDGVCRYIGCTSTDECPTTPEHPNWSCEVSSGFPYYPLCALVCNTADDCAAPGTSYAGKYDCTEHRCRYLGCKSNAECAMQQNDPAYICAD